MKRKHDSRHFEYFFGALFVVAVAYCAVSNSAYRARHPEKTETQLFFSLREALRWE